MPTREQLREWGRKGGKARAAMPDFLEHQSHAGKCSAAKTDMAALGSKGAKACIRAHGYGHFYRLARDWRLKNPSRHEQIMMTLLDDLGLVYEREAEPLGANTYVCVDFLLESGHVIEVNGKVHYDPLFDHPNYPGNRAKKDQARITQLERAGFQVIVIDHHDLARPGHVKAIIEEALQDERDSTLQLC